MAAGVVVATATAFVMIAQHDYFSFCCTAMSAPVLKVRHLGRQPYAETWGAMRRFTDSRDAHTPSELWVVEHPAVFTQGQAGKAEHLLETGDIPVVQSDRGGQVTYHGPGQLVIYLLIGLREAGLGVRGLVTQMEDAIIDVLADYGVVASSRRDAPGVYVEGQKIASLGLRVRRGYTYHGLALNVCNALSPFDRINPCGFPGLSVTRTKDVGISASIDEISNRLIKRLATRLGYQLDRSDLPPIGEKTR